MQQLISEVKVDKRRHVKDRNFCKQVRDREIQWQRKLQCMVKEGENVIGITRFSQNLAGKISKTCKCVR